MAWTNKTKNPIAVSTNKTKNSIAVSTNKTKILQQGAVGEIQTPNGSQILVGSSENLTLIYKESFNNWSLKTKIGN